MHPLQLINHTVMNKMVSMHICKVHAVSSQSTFLKEIV